VRVIIFLAIVILGGAAGDVAISHAMKQIGAVEVLRPDAIARALLRAFREIWFWIGIALMALAFFSLLALLSWEDVSVVVPATALTYVAAALGGKFVLHEDVAPVRWAGVLLVCVGVVLLSLN
jgi:multidrug transporter EmrE-like cation transporter